MYRARVDSVSGTKVFAGGKWLQCIGNKNVRIGDYVWTDGRCVYGNNQVPQQPLVIIAQEDEGIPIVLDRSSSLRSLYSFTKGSLKLVEETTDIKALVNNKSSVYYHDCLAANIDEHGNVFAVTTGTNAEDSEYIGILKNGEIVRKIDLTEFINNNLRPKYKKPKSLYEGYYIWDDGLFTFDLAEGYVVLWEDFGGRIEKAFIKNDTDFEIILYAAIAGNLRGANGEYFIAASSYGGYFQIKNDEITEIRCTADSGEARATIYTPSDNASPPYVIFYNVTNYPNDKNVINRTFTETINPIKGSTSDSFYYTMTWQRLPEGVENNTINAHGEFLYEYFSPRGEKIAEITAGANQSCLFRKIQDGYLIALNGLKIHNMFGLKIDDILKNGIYLYQDSTNQLICLESGVCLNDRLRPMKKIKNWQNRLRELVPISLAKV